jgi:hypothetical protein
LSKAALVALKDVSAVGRGNVGEDVAATSTETAVELGLVHRSYVQSQVAAFMVTVKAEY